MIRSPVLTSIFAVVLLMSCAAQDERRSLENSVTRLEQRLARMDEYLKSLQSNQTQQKEERLEALQQAQQELARLRELVLSQEKAMREETAATDKKMEALRKAAEQQAAQQEKAAAETRRKEQALAQEAERAKEARRKEQAAAQEAERAKVAESKARAEQQVLAEKTRTLTQELEQSKKAASDRAAENAKLAKEKEALAAAAKQQRDRSVAEQDEIKRQKDANKQQVEDLKRQLATREADSRKRGDDYSRTVEQLSQERREIERLREAVKNDLATESKRAAEAAKKRADTQELKAREADEEMAKLRSQNASLKKQVQALEQAKDQQPARSQPRIPAAGFDDFGPAPTPARAAPPPARSDAPPGTIIVNNSEGGEVHFHFHGGAPTINQPAQAPRAAPKQAEPAEKTLKVKEPAKAKDQAPKQESAKKINEDPEPVAANLIRVLWGRF